MKAWNAPDVTELNISETANGYFKVSFEGPFDVVFGDRGDKSDSNDSTPNEEISGN